MISEIIGKNILVFYGWATSVVPYDYRSITRGRKTNAQIKREETMFAMDGEQKIIALFGMAAFLLFSKID